MSLNLVFFVCFFCFFEGKEIKSQAVRIDDKHLRLFQQIVVESSNVDRCLMSAYCNLAGLYPPNEMQMWNRNISWQPIPVHTRPEQEDNVCTK